MCARFFSPESANLHKSLSNFTITHFRQEIMLIKDPLGRMVCCNIHSIRVSSVFLHNNGLHFHDSGFTTLRVVTQVFIVPLRPVL